MPPPETNKSEIGSQPTMCQVHTGAYVPRLAPGKTDYTACHPRKTTTYRSHVVPITTHTHDRRKSVRKKKLKKKRRKMKEKTRKRERKRKGSKEKTRQARQDKTRRGTRKGEGQGGKAAGGRRGVLPKRLKSESGHHRLEICGPSNARHMIA